MYSVSATRRTYSDPDVISLIKEQGGDADPYEIARDRAEDLLRQLKTFGGCPQDGFERVRILASIAGFDVKPMDSRQAERQGREAMLVSTNGDEKRGIIFYDPQMPLPRIIFSIAHEIAHSFFPISRVGARFRSFCAESSRGARELEMICHFGASELTMPTKEFHGVVARQPFSLLSVDSIRMEFETSFEATLYRMAATACFPAAAGLARFKYKLNEIALADQTAELFPARRDAQVSPCKRYRRQSFYYSDSYPRYLVLPWNKSFPESSCIYRAAESGAVESGQESIPLDGRGKQLDCFIEAKTAPFQGSDADPDLPDVLFLLKLA